MGTTRRSFLKSVAAGAVCSVLGAGTARAATKPNIVYILADDLGYGDLACYGQTKILTPNIDRLAAEGMRFTNHYAGSNICAPSRCVLMTGLHTGHSYVRDNRPLPVEGNVPLPAGTQTVGKLLKTAGYTTGAMGKWGLGYPGSEGDPNNQGFDHFFGYNCQREAHEYYPPHLWRNDKKVMLEGNANGKQEQYSHDLIAEEALWFLREHSDKPFFLYVPFTIPHTKFQVPDLGPYADKDWEENLRIHAAMITRMDADVGRIMALIKELGVEENTLVMFASDNGAHGGGGTYEFFKTSGPLRDKKASMYEGGLRAPLIARWPDRIAQGTTSEHICGMQDMLPTFAELAGAAVPKPVDGISMLPTLLGTGSQTQHTFLYWERAKATAVRMGDWKAVRNTPNGAIELYNLADDPSESKNLAAEHPETVAKIARLMEESHAYTPWFDWEYTGPMPQ
jgi:arylsulfatase A-like enzyme